MKKGGVSESTIITGPSKSVLVYVLHSLEYILGLARFRVFVSKLKKCAIFGTSRPFAVLFSHSFFTFKWQFNWFSYFTGLSQKLSKNITDILFLCRFISLLIKNSKWKWNQLSNFNTSAVAKHWPSHAEVKKNVERKKHLNKSLNFLGNSKTSAAG